MFERFRLLQDSFGFSGNDPQAGQPSQGQGLSNRIECLDGLRGLASLWVLIGHCMMFTGFALPILGKPDLGVDLFMYLSGFLMVFQYNLRKEREDWSRPAVWVSFWVRRFFRLSPLYYVLLIAGLIAGNVLFADRTLIDTFLGNPPQAAERFNDASATNVITHLSYVYGLLPQYAYRSPLPDWSLALEMQFYAVFPLLAVFARKIGWSAMVIAVAGLAIAIALLTHRMGLVYPMPTFLPLKMHMFLAGVVVAIAGGRYRFFALPVALALAAVPGGGPNDPVHMAVRIVILCIFFVLVHGQHISLLGKTSRTLGSPFFHWLGELSYGVYLVHLLILHGVAAWTIRQWGHGITPAVRFAITFAIVAALCYAFSYLTYRTIEQPGQLLGRKVLKFFGRKGQALQTPAEEIAAP